MRRFESSAGRYSARGSRQLNELLGRLSVEGHRVLGHGAARSSSHRTGTVSLGGNAVVGALSAQQGAPTFLQAPLDSADGVRAEGQARANLSSLIQQHQTCRFGQLDVEGIGQAEGVAARYAPASSDERPCGTGTCRNSSSAHRRRAAVSAPARCMRPSADNAPPAIEVRRRVYRGPSQPYRRHRSLVRARESGSTMALGVDATTCSGGGRALSRFELIASGIDHAARHHCRARWRYRFQPLKPRIGCRVLQLGTDRGLSPCRDVQARALA